MEVFLLLVVVDVLVLRTFSGREVRREDLDPELLEAFDYLMAHLDSTIQVGPIRYTKTGQVQVELDGELYRVVGDGSSVYITAKDPLWVVGSWYGNDYGWVFHSDFYFSRTQKTIRLT